MKNLFWILALTVLTGCIAGCSSKEQNDRHPEARALYNKSLELGKLYTDSLLHAKDSARVEYLSKAYEEALTKLNYQFSPDLDLEISQSENDTLASVAFRFVEIKDSILLSFARKSEIETDSI